MHSVFTGFVRRVRYDRRTQLCVGRERPVKARQVQPRVPHQRRQALQEFQRREPQVCDSVAPGDATLSTVIFPSNPSDHSSS